MFGVTVLRCCGVTALVAEGVKAFGAKAFMQLLEMQLHPSIRNAKL